MATKVITENQLIEGWIQMLRAAGYSYEEMGPVFKHASEKQAQYLKEKQILNKQLDYRTGA